MIAATTSRRRLILGVLIALLLVAVVGIAVGDPLPQDKEYHGFVDQRSAFGIPNFANVLSNLPFVAVGLLGLLAAARRRHGSLRWTTFFIGVIATGFGSAYYHLDPNNRALVFDRLPMAVSFAAMLAIVLVERWGGRARLAFWPLLVAGIGSVIYWAACDDLIPYAMVQFGFLAATLVLIVGLPSPVTHGGMYFEALGFYILAKILEAHDDIWFLGLSGHTWKHLAAAAAVATLYLMYRIRRTLPAGGTEVADELTGRDVLFYDGACGFCHRAVRQVIAHDPDSRWKFAPLQGELARTVLPRHGIDPSRLDSLVTVVEIGTDRERAENRTDGTLALAWRLHGKARLVLGLWLLPTLLRDAAYALIARVRYSLFGHDASCPIPSPEQRERFLD